MTTQQEWTEKAMKQGDMLVLLETANDYVELLREGRTDWHKYYEVVSELVQPKQSDSA